MLSHGVLQICGSGHSLRQSSNCTQHFVQSAGRSVLKQAIVLQSIYYHNNQHKEAAEKVSSLSSSTLLA